MVLVKTPGVDEITLTLTTQFGLGAIVALLSVNEDPPGTAVKVAEGPQFDNELDGKGGFAMTTLAGKLSVMDAPVKSPLGALLLIVTLSTLTSPTKTVFGEKDLLTEGGLTPTTVNVALAGVVLVIETPPPVELNSPAGIVLIKLPMVVEVTSIATVHSPGVMPTWAGTVPPLSDKVVVPGTAVTLPPQELEMFAGFAIDNPGCTPARLSVQEASFKSNELGL
jgi:hypothetical protein